MLNLKAMAPQIADFCRRNEMRQLSVFGSAARGDSRSDSDVDFLVEFCESARPGLVSISRMTRELEELLGIPVDLVTERSLNPLIRDRVLRESKVVFAAG